MGSIAGMAETDFSRETGSRGFVGTPSFKILVSNSKVRCLWLKATPGNPTYSVLACAGVALSQARAWP